MPFFYGRWDDAARAHALVGFSERARAVQAGFYAPGAFDPPATTAGLAQVTTRGWMIPPGSLPGCWPSWADPPGPAWVRQRTRPVKTRQLGEPAGNHPPEHSRLQPDSCHPADPG